jgi:hypothetical protein
MVEEFLRSLGTYNGYFPAELILDFAFLIGIWAFILDD